MAYKKGNNFRFFKNAYGGPIVYNEQGFPVTLQTTTDPSVEKARDCGKDCSGKTKGIIDYSTKGERKQERAWDKEQAKADAEAAKQKQIASDNYINMKYGFDGFPLDGSDYDNRQQRYNEFLKANPTFGKDPSYTGKLKPKERFALLDNMLLQVNRAPNISYSTRLSKKFNIPNLKNLTVADMMNYANQMGGYDKFREWVDAGGPEIQRYGGYISDRAKATEFGQYKMGGGYFPPYHSYTPPRMDYGGDISIPNVYPNQMVSKFGPGGESTDGCPPGYNKNPLTGECMPNGWVAPSAAPQSGPTQAAARQADMNYISNVAKNNKIQPNQGQQATVSRSQSDEAWRQAQVAEMKRKEAMRNSALAQSMAGLTPSGNIDAGVIGAESFVNMTPGIGIIPATGRLATFINSATDNTRQGENAYYSQNNSFGENALGALNFVGDIGMLGVGSPLKSSGINVSSGIPGVSQAGFNPIGGAKKFMNKVYGKMDEMFGGTGNDVLFPNESSKAGSNSPKISYRGSTGLFGDEAVLEHNGKTYIIDQNNPNRVVIDEGNGNYTSVGSNNPEFSKIQEIYNSADAPVNVERTYPFRNQAEIEHNGDTYFVNKDNPTEIMVTKLGERTLSRASEADIPRVQEKYSATLPQETATPTPAAPAVAPAPVQQTAAPAKPTTQPVKPLEQNLSAARAQSNPTPGTTATERNTGNTPKPVTNSKGKTNYGKSILKGAGVLGGVGLGIYGAGRVFNSDVPTKPFVNAPNTVNNSNSVNVSDTMFYPATDTVYNNTVDTSGYVNPNTGQPAPLTQQEIQQALDTSGIPRQRFGGQQYMRRFQNGGMISIEGLQNALNKIKI